jgi:hypothetical protein
MKHREFTARMELKSLTRSIKCVKTECGDLELLSECLGHSSMRLGVPFIALRQLGAVGDQQGRQFLHSVGWRTGHCPVHTGQSCAPCRPLARAMRRPRIARSTVALAAVGSPDSPVNYSCTSPSFPESGQFAGIQPGAPDTIRWTTGQSGVPDRAESWLLRAKSFSSSLFSDSST